MFKKAITKRITFNTIIRKEIDRQKTLFYVKQ